MTDDEFKLWASSPDAARCVLVEAAAYSGGEEVTRYLSNVGYVTGATDSPANTTYTPCIAGGVSVSETLPINGKASMSWGDIEISNLDGRRDAWLDDVWSGRPIKILVGDVRWPRADFRLVFSGVVEDITARGPDNLNLLLRDKGQRLNTSLTEATLDNSTLKTDKLRPLCFGEVHNITPVLVDEGTLTYMVHDGPIEGIIEVRDNGIPVSYGVNLAQGTFALSATPVGTVTASVQGAKPGGTYLNTVGPLVKHIAKTYGATPLAAEDVDDAQIDAFSAAHPQVVGAYYDSRENMLSALQTLAASVGAQVAPSPEGKLQIKKIELPPTGPAASFTASDMVYGTPSVSSTPALQPAIRIGYCRNHTIQRNLQTGLPAAHAELYGLEWLVVQVKDEALAARWNQSTSPEEVSTLLQTRLSAEGEATRRLALWGVRRQVLKFDAFGGAVLLPVGSAATLTHSRFGLSGGKLGQIVGKKTDWLTQKVSFEVLV